MTIPTVDVSAIDDTTAHHVLKAAQDYGFVYISGHSIPPSLINEIWTISHAYFTSDEISKRGKDDEFLIGRSNAGYSPPKSEKLDLSSPGHDDKESFNFDPRSPLPPLLDQHKDVLIKFRDHCRRVSLRILQLFSVSMNSDFVTWHRNEGGTMLRILYYPRSNEGVIAGAHTDYGSLTLLFQKPGQDGLEIEVDGHWVPVPAPPITENSEDEIPICVNVADQLEIWTRGQLKSTRHRVVSHGGERMSIAYFCHPDDNTPLEIDGRKMTAREHLDERLRATYG